MKILLDECVPRLLRRYLISYEVKSVAEMGWNSIKNGKLLMAYQNSGFDILLTVDKQMRNQQNMSLYAIAVVLLNANTNKVADLIPFIPELDRLAATLPKFKVTVIEKP